MYSQISTISNDLPTTGSPTTPAPRDEWALVPEEGSSAPEVPEAHEASESKTIDDWEVLDEEVDRPGVGTTRAQSRRPSDSSSRASSTLTTPGLEVGFFPPVAPIATTTPAVDNGTALITGPSPYSTDSRPDEVYQGPFTDSGSDSVNLGPSTDPGPATSSGPGSYTEFAFGAVEPSCSEIDSFAFSPRPTNAPPSRPVPLQFASEPAIFSFGPGLSPDEPRALFSLDPIVLFSKPELANSRPLAFSGATFPTFSGPSPPQSSRSAFSPGPSYTFSHGPYSVGPETYTFGPGPSSNGPETSSTDPGPTSFSPGPTAYDPIMGSGPTYFGPGPSAADPMMGLGPPSFGPGPSATDPTMGHGPASFGPGPSATNLIMCPGPASVSPGPTANNSIMGPGLTAYANRFGPGPISFVPGPTVYTGPASFRPGPTAHNSIIGPGPGPIFDPCAPSITVNHTSIKRDACKRFLCGPCNKGFDRVEHLERHKATNSHANNHLAEGMPLNALPSLTVSCPFCGRKFNRRDNLRPHLLRHMDSGNLTRTRQVSVDDSIRMGYAHIDPRCAHSFQTQSKFAAALVDLTE